MAIGARLKMARKMARMSQQALGEVVGVSRMAISKYERDLMDPSSAVLIALAQALDVTVDYMKRLILRALAEDVITRSRAAELLGQSLAEFWEAERQRHDGFPEPVRA